MIHYKTLADAKPSTGQCVALGYFDGVHLGHQKVLGSAIESAKKNNLQSAVFTFSFSGENTVKSAAIMTAQERENRICQLGIDVLTCVDFNEIKSFTPVEFVEKVLKDKLNAKHIFCGDNYRFGKNAAGDINLLKTLCSTHGITVNIVDMYTFNGELVSSTRIKSALLNGDIDQANTMLNIPYNLNFVVEHGKALGRTLGFPTINQHFPVGILVPKQGVYITRTLVEGVWYASATGVTTKPTVGGTDVSCETFITDINLDLYGTNPVVEFHAYYQDAKKYDSLDALKAFIQQTATASKKFFNKK